MKENKKNNSNISNTKNFISEVHSFSTSDNKDDINIKSCKNNLQPKKIFLNQNNENMKEILFEEWRFSGDKEESNKLFKLVIDGTKTATSYVFEGSNSLSDEGLFSFLTNYDKSKKVKIKTTKLYTCKFKDVTAEHAFKEGEGDLSLDYWKKVHKDFFSKQLESKGKTFSEDIEIVCEEFELI